MSDDSRSKGDDGKLLYCSFCGKSQHEVRKLIAGPSVFICDECVELCNDIIREELDERAERGRDKLPKPHEIKAVLEALVVVVDGDRKNLLRSLLPDDVLVEHLLDLGRFRQLVAAALGALVELLANDVVAKLDAFVANENRGACDQLTDFMLALAAERAIKQLAVV